MTLVDISRREICQAGGLDFSTQIGTVLSQPQSTPVNRGLLDPLLPHSVITPRTLMVGSSANSATSDANVFQCLGRVHPKLVSSSVSKSMVFIGSTGQIDDLQSAHECS